MIYQSVKEYLYALDSEGAEPIVTVTMAAEAFGISNQAIAARLNKGTLDGVEVSGTKYITVDSVMKQIKEFDKKVRATKKYLEAQASKGVKSIYYKQVMEHIGLSHSLSADRRIIAQILGQVSTLSYRESKTLLSIIVHRKDTGAPSEEGFFGLLPSLKKGWIVEVADRDKFIKKETKRLIKAHK